MRAGKGQQREETTEKGIPPTMTLFFLSFRMLERGLVSWAQRQQGALICNPHWASLLDNPFHATSP